MILNKDFKVEWTCTECDECDEWNDDYLGDLYYI